MDFHCGMELLYPGKSKYCCRGLNCQERTLHFLLPRSQSGHGMSHLCPFLSDQQRLSVGFVGSRSYCLLVL